VAIEFALVAPFLLAFMFIIIDFGRAFNYLNDTNQIAANGARLAAVNKYPGGAALALQGDTNELKNGGGQVPSKLTVCVKLPVNPASGTTGKVGDPVQVKAKATFKLLPIIGGLDIPIQGSATMRLERAPSFVGDCPP
jgi:hypothetical protein